MLSILSKIKNQTENPSSGHAAWKIQPVMKLELSN